MGNKDSVEIGYDPLATDTTDVAFGETELPPSTPFDSLLETRLGTDAIIYTSNPKHAGRKIILKKKNNLACIPGGSGGTGVMTVQTLYTCQTG